MRTFLLCGALALFVAPAVAAQTPPADPLTRLEQLVKDNTLDREGLRPWHLRMAFTLYDEGGKKKENGMIEELWASPRSRRLVITSPSYNATMPSLDESHPLGGRVQYLIDELLSQFIRPFPPTEMLSRLDLKEEERTFAKVKLTCLSANAKPGGKFKPTPEAALVFCTEPGSEALRLKLSQSANFIRNRPARFQNTNVALDNEIAYQARPAIEGHVEKLETFDPATAGIVLDTQAERPSVPSVLLAGKLLEKYTPTYPQEARLQHISGTVALYGMITKSGRLGSLSVISSPSPMLSQAALDAVKAWVYSPYMLNGEATEVDTTITINFNLNN